MGKFILVLVGEPHGQKANIKKSRGSGRYRRFDR